jgi:hypothetical protein
MPDYLITYDLADGSPDPHKPFLTAAAAEGLLYVWKGANYVNRLPNTTVWGVFATKEAADNAFDRALATAAKAVGHSVTMEKRCTTGMDNTSVTSDRRKKPEARWTGRTSFETSRLHQLNDPFFR